MKKILVAAVLVGGLSGCQALEKLFDNSLPDAVKEQLEEHDAALQVYEEAIARTEAQVEASLQVAREAAKVGDWAATQTALSEISSLEQQHGKLVESFNTQASQARRIVEQAVQPATSGLFAVLDPLIPIPLQPLVPLASSLLVMLGSSRARKHTKRALRHVLVGQLGDGVRDVLKAVGAAHSSAASKKAAEEGEAPKPAPTDPSV